MKIEEITTEQLKDLVDASQPLLIALLSKTVFMLNNASPEEIMRALMADFMEMTTPEEGEDLEVHYFSLAVFMALQMHLMGKSYLREGTRNVAGL